MSAATSTVLVMSFFDWRGRAAKRHPKVTLVPMPAGAITTSTASLLERRGWRQQGKTYSGPYATPYGTWHGLLEDTGGGHTAGDYFRCYIYNPPIDILAYHPKLPCFSAASDGWWRVNLARSPIDGDPSAIVLHIERLLIEAHRLAGIT